MTYAGAAANHLGRWEEAVVWFKRSIQANRNYPFSHFHLSAALAQLGQLEEARGCVEVGLGLNPSFTVSRARVAWTAMAM
jgi:tetratricopeptide (TPR) repeat protein